MILTPLAACSACLPTAARPAAPLRFSHLSPRGRQFLHLENFDVTSEVGVLLGEVGIDIEHSSVVSCTHDTEPIVFQQRDAGAQPNRPLHLHDLPSVAKGRELAALSLLGPAALRCCCRCQSPRTIADFSCKCPVAVSLVATLEPPDDLYFPAGKSWLRF